MPPFIRGDGTGPDIWAASVRVFDAAVQKAYGGKRKISWFEVFAGEDGLQEIQQLAAGRHRRGVQGISGRHQRPADHARRRRHPLAQRRAAPDARPLRLPAPRAMVQGVPSPVKHPEKVDMVIFRENTEDIYAGIEYAAGTPEAQKILDFWPRNFPRTSKNPLWHQGGGRAILAWKAVGAPEFPADVRCRHRHQAGQLSRHVRLIHSAIAYAIKNKRKSVTIVHKGNIMKFTEGAFRDWGYELAKERFFGAVEIDGGPWCKIPEGKPGAGLVIKDAIADITLQQVLTRPTDFDVIATLNLNGDYLSDALAAQVGGIGIAPGGNINYITGHAIFEATHGTAPKYANKDVVNPGSSCLSGEMMFRYLGWTEAADLILKGLNGAIGSKRVTYDFARQMEGATEIKCLAAVVKRDEVTGDKICGAISGYLLMGMSWAFLYGLIEVLRPGSFLEAGQLIAPDRAAIHQFALMNSMLYYSLATLTTTTYGDILPKTTSARALSNLEGVAGQMYVAVLIARLVALHILYRFNSRPQTKD
jgi:isocitrate dehydrogenase